MNIPAASFVEMWRAPIPAMKKLTLVSCALIAVLAITGCVPKSELEKAQADLAAMQSKASGLQSELDVAKKAQTDLAAMQSKVSSVQSEMDFTKKTLAELQIATAKNPAGFLGTWRVQTTRETANLLGGNITHGVEATIILDKTGRGSLMTTVDGGRVENVVGPWGRVGEFLVIEGNTGFASFKVAAKSEAKMTLVNREGKITEWTKIH